MPKEILEYLNALYRYRLIAVCALAVGATLTLYTVQMLPNLYRSTTMIMVEPQNVPESYVKATITTRLDKRLRAMNQEVLSRTRLEAIIDDLGLFSAARQAGATMEGIVERMRRHISIQVFNDENGFRISYEGGDPGTVQRVTARLASLYIDENLRIREQHASGTTEFMESELNKIKVQLQEQEARIQAFKQQHMGELPEQQAANMNTLEGHRTQLQTLQVALSAALERKLILDRQAAEGTGLGMAQAGVAGAPALGSPTLRLVQLRAQLSDLQGRYTENHPDVIRARAQIAELQEELGSAAAPRADPLLPPELARSLGEARVEIKRLKENQERVRQAVDTYQARVENAFVREQQLQSLTRDYAVTYKKYQTLLDKKLEAQLSQSLERRQKAERFRVLDPASRPEAPARPNRMLLTVAGIAASLALALLLPFLLARMNTSFHGPEELADSALPVLAVIPELATPDVRFRLWQYRLRVLALSGVTLVIGLGGASYYANFMF